MALPELKQTATDARLSALELPKGGCLTAARQAALARVQTMGLPSRRDEYWKYTRPDSLVQADAVPAAVFHNAEEPMFSNRDRLRIVFVDGVFNAEQSDDLTLEGVRIDRLGYLLH
jgi:Fe-S cluster assembly protein SufD